jgi:hypothetical protein
LKIYLTALAQDLDSPNAAKDFAETGLVNSKQKSYKNEGASVNKSRSDKRFYFKFFRVTNLAFDASYIAVIRLIER